MSAQNAARRVLEVHVKYPSDEVEMCGGCRQLQWPCDTAIVAKAVLTQGTCGTCVNWAEDERWCTELVCSMSQDDFCSRHEPCEADKGGE